MLSSKNVLSLSPTLEHIQHEFASFRSVASDMSVNIFLFVREMQSKMNSLAWKGKSHKTRIDLF